MENKLPKNWVETELGSILKLKNGYAFKSKDYKDEGVPVIRISNISDGKINFSKAAFVDKSLANENFYVKKGDILIAMSGATTGKYGIYDYNEIALQNQRVGNFELLSAKSINKKFVYHLVGVLKEEIENRAYGGAQPNISPKLIETLPIKLPPRAEQDRIVNKLDGLFEQLESINKSISNLESIKERFLYSCLVDRKQQSFYKRLTIGKFLKEGTERIGENWNKCRLIGVSAKEGITDLRVGQKKSFEKYKVVRKGDFIYNTMRVNIGSIAIYNEDAPAITSPDYVVFRTNKKLSSDLLLGFLKSEQGLLEIGANTKGSVRARLYFKSLSNIRMPYGEEVQQLAQNFLSTYNSTLMDLNKLFDSKIPELRQSILNKAFKGELVPQLESDGDAQELLKKIEGLKKDLN